MSLKNLMNQAIDLNLFDYEWYQNQHKCEFKNNLNAFEDYIRKSPFSDISPSANFDTILYYENNPDIYESGMSSLEHYIRFGKNEGRKIYPLRPLWLHKNIVATSSKKENKNKCKIAVVLHIYYIDFVEIFANALSNVEFEFDLYVTATNHSVELLVSNNFNKNNKVKSIFFKTVPNLGRNFSFLVEFRKELVGYDLFLHLHSKKSLYSGKEQVQWSNYLVEYLVRDKHVLTQALDILTNNENIGLYYPTSFWNLPPWVSHWLKNKGLGRAILKNRFGIEDNDEFFSYPVGGMFWARTKALKDLLNYEWSYDDFPPEPLPADGTILHVIERIIPKISENNGFSQFFYYPPTGAFTMDKSHIYRSYYNQGSIRYLNTVENAKILSFDIFDTVVKRDFYEPDYAKYFVPSRAGILIDAAEFVKIRNEVELNIRKKNNFEGDVDIYEIYQELVDFLPGHQDPKFLADLEFAIDLDFLSAKTDIVDIINVLSFNKTVWFISDTYYTKSQISTILYKVGVRCNYELYVSSDIKCRKDNGTMWDMILTELDKFDCKKPDYLHIGDNVCSDSQLPGDRGIRTFHILSPLDKWLALGFDSDVPKNISINRIDLVDKWGQLIAQVGASPFI